MPLKVDVTINTDEIIVAMNSKRKAVLEAVRSKTQDIVEIVTDEFLRELPGQYVDPKTINFNVQTISGGVLGYIEATDKGGFYLILPNKARALSFIAKSGDWVRTARVYHPYLKGSKYIEQYLLESKPWIESQIIQAAEDAWR